jgi:histidyl-tRNA synthetase
MAEGFQTPRGFHDIIPPESEKFNRIRREARKLLESHGFEEIVLPVVEFADLFQRSIGEVTDIVQKEMFLFQDRKGRLLALRPEGTAGAVRAYIQHRLWTKRPYHRLFYEGPMFRHERPQAGRYRQFHQVGAEIFGTDSPRADAEIIHIVSLLLQRLGVSAKLEINSIGCRECRPAYREALVGFLKGVEKELCTDCRTRMERNPLRVLDCKVESCQSAVRGAPRTVDYLCEGCRTHYETLKELLTSLGIDFSENPRLVRGLDYYTRTVFEAVSLSLGKTLVAGGRYDYLVEELGGPPTPALGFAIGVERLMLEMTLPSEKKPLYFVIPFGDTFTYAIRVAQRLRSEGKRVEVSLRKGGLKKQLEFANRIGADFAVIVGEDEEKGGYFTLKDMRKGEQTPVYLKD